MRTTTINLSVPSAHDRAVDMRTTAAAIQRPWRTLLVAFLLAAGAQFAFGMWMNARGFIYVDAYSRAVNALLALYSSSPHLAAIGFIWMPLPSLIEMFWVVMYPLWPAVVSTGFASTLTTALASGATAALLLATARKLDLNPKLAWVYTLVVVANPMLFLYGSNGLSEGVAAPFLTGAVCALVLFWRTGRRRYVALVALALALGTASLYEAIPFGAALFAAVVLGALWETHESRLPGMRSHWRTAEGLGILVISPSFYVVAAWVAANALIMKNPLYFATSEYSNYGQTLAVGGGGLARQTAGDIGKTLAYVFERVLPFLIPSVGVVVVRALDKRFWRVNTLSLALLLLSVPFGLIAPLIYLGASFGWLRFFMYPLFVAAGWGLYEISLSQQRRMACVAILAGWIVAVPFIVSAMANPGLGQEEHWEMHSLLTGKSAGQIIEVNQRGEDTSFSNWLSELAPVATYLDSGVFSRGQSVALDAFQGSAIAAQVQPRYLGRLLILTPDRQFVSMIEHPSQYHISYVLVPNPAKVPQDMIDRAYPLLWSGRQPGFVLVHSFPDTPQNWRLYALRAP